MTLLSKAAVAAALFICMAGYSTAQDYGPKDAQGTPASVHSVQSGGHWERGNDEGFYRVLVTSGGFEHVIARLFIQWIVLDQDKREYRLQRSVEVKEIGIASVITPSPKFAMKGNWTMPVAITRRDGKREKRTVTVRPDGYSFK
ncbi:MAG: hypothetical protein FJX62_16865 [Alphaproteobacteria bacterium]|nr:hypothetical protein [Alphaproteobacteria bacterium]